MGFAAEVAVWWALLTGLWLITLPSFAREEGLVAAACAVGAAVAVAGARRAVQGAWHPRLGWARWAVPVVVAVPVETVRVLALGARQLVRRSEGVGDRVQRLPIGGEEPDAVGAARRALGTFALTATPGSVVIDWDPDRGELVLHRLVPGATDLEHEVLP
jgi:multisubunit Na+/H+ antiporter MnhE subunit